MAVFTRSTIIPATPQALFDFHENPHNLRAISPAGLEIVQIDAGQRAIRGETFTIAVKNGPFTLRWTGQWDKVEAPHLLVDSGIRCPFSLWHHHHIFAEHPDGALLTDRVVFRLPWHLGGPLGDWVVRTLVFPRMFAGRHAATRAFFSRVG